MTIIPKGYKLIYSPTRSQRGDRCWDIIDNRWIPVLKEDRNRPAREFTCIIRKKNENCKTYRCSRYVGYR